MGGVALAMEEGTAQLVFQLHDRPRQRRLGDVALLRRPREVELLRHRQKIADLMHLHLMARSATPSLVDRPDNKPIAPARQGCRRRRCAASDPAAPALFPNCAVLRPRDIPVATLALSASADRSTEKRLCQMARLGYFTTRSEESRCPTIAAGELPERVDLLLVHCLNRSAPATISTYAIYASL